MLTKYTVLTLAKFPEEIILIMISKHFLLISKLYLHTKAQQ